MAFHAKVPFVALLGLMHLGVAFFVCVPHSMSLSVGRFMLNYIQLIEIFSINVPFWRSFLYPSEGLNQCFLRYRADVKRGLNEPAFYLLSGGEGGI